MKKTTYLFIFILITILFKTSDVFAFNINASQTTIYTGSTVAITIDASDLTGKFITSSSNENVLAGGKVEWYEFSTDIVYFSARNAGQAVITVYSDNPSNTSFVNQGEVARSITINVIERPTYTEPIEINRTYSANNYLSNLVVEGFELAEFDKEKLEYDLEVDNTVTKINIAATVEDDTATVYGAGEIDIVEGKNEIKIIVTAENGNERTYVVNIIVKELNPINVKINKEDFTLVKKEDSLPELDNYVKSTIKIDGNDIPALKGKITKYTLVGLKDKKGDIALYIYDAKDKTYKPYNEIKFNNISLYYMENNNTNYKKTIIKINGKEVTSYKKSGLDYYLIYGMNLDTGKVNWYTYDKEEGTIQKYVGSNKVSVIDNNSYKYLVYILSGISSILVLFMMILFVKYKKKID